MTTTNLRSWSGAWGVIGAMAIAGCAMDGAADDDPGGPGGSDGPGMAAGRLRIQGQHIVDDRGTPVRLTGVNWFGLETPSYAPHGLWQRPMGAMLDQVKALGFNVLRVPFCSQLFDAGSTPNGIDLAQNPELAGKTGAELLDRLITAAGERGLRVILDRHRPDSGAQSPVWYTAAYSEERWIQDWVMLARKYGPNPTVVAFDLHNEPHAQATWGDGNQATDWRLAAQRAGNAILAVDPDALIIIEGVEVVAGTSYWWGGNLAAAMTMPIELSAPGHVIYSPHEYPASIYAQRWFSAPDYPANLPALWDATWGSLAATAPVLVGEFGTKLATDVDRKWLDSLAHYLAARGMSFTFWALNPDSGDTGGILGDDWITVNQDKMAYLTPILAPRLPMQ
jgi:endoglucanase